jgi:hypothetical protein
MIGLEFEEAAYGLPRLIELRFESVRTAQVIERRQIARIHGDGALQVGQRYAAIASLQEDAPDHPVPGGCLLDVVSFREVHQCFVISALLHQDISGSKVG